MKRFLLLSLIVVPVMGLLLFSLNRNPRGLPSSLVGREGPDFSLETLEGKVISLKSFRGDPVILNFWATWCGTCLAEHREIQAILQEFGGTHLRLFSILHEDSPSNAKEFIQSYGKGGEILLDPGLRTAIDYGVSGVPETFFIDPSGNVLYKHSGPLTRELLTRQIRLLSPREAS